MLDEQVGLKLKNKMSDIVFFHSCNDFPKEFLINFFFDVGFIIH